MQHLHLYVSCAQKGNWFPSHSYPLAKNIVEVCEHYDTDGQAREKFDKLSDVCRLAVLALNPVTQEKIHVDLNIVFQILWNIFLDYLFPTTPYPYLQALYSNTEEQENRKKDKSSGLQIRIFMLNN